MKRSLQSSRLAERELSVPSEIYIPLVDSLYKDGRTLLIGTVGVAASILATFWKTGEPLFLVCAVALVAVACARGLVMRAYARARPMVKSNAVARRWERRYVAGAAASVGLLGIWCYIAFARTDDAVAHLISISITIAYVIGIFGRNFGSSRSVIVQILCAWVPMTAALVLHGGVYHWILAGLLVLFFLAVKLIAERLRLTLLEAVVASRDMALLAERFDTALNNMPHGLCMFDAHRRIAVANARLNQHLGLSKVELKGLSPEQLVTLAADAGLIAAAHAGRLSDDLNARLSGAETQAFILDAQNGRTLEFTVQPMENGGTVLLVEDTTERRNAQAKINHLARFDSLTGLPNRTILRNRMDSALADCAPDRMCAIHFIDLDQFKQVNDTLGHSRGDMLLIAVAERLRKVVRDSDVVARFGGDEFVVLQHPVTSLDQASALAKRMVEGLKGNYEIDGYEVAVSASIGIAVADAKAVDADQLLRNSDMALYRAKSENRGTWRWFEVEMEARAQARRSLELDLRSALENDAFDLHYQPIFDIRTRRIVSSEALLRWHHPERGMVPPGQFISVAEEMGIIVEIGEQVLRKACLECRRWPGDTGVAVNLSSIQFSRSNVPALIRRTLAATALPPGRLHVEITESTLLHDTSKTRAALRQLEALGVRVSLDDFGTGYSSLSYLHSFPLHKVKIDQSFLQDLENSRQVTLLRGMARLSAELGLRVTVEGVETDEQLALIATETSVDEVQGYLLGRPLPAADFRKLLDATNGAAAPVEQVA